MADHYADGTYLWWHLSRTSLELAAALGDGCGLGTEAAYLASVGWRVAGMDLSQTALRRAAAEHDDVAFVATAAGQPARRRGAQRH
jgi:2-polyprenyl-3-methyl-5-hydroxy-6-metoxy-1,4-benzoquinol methylase